MSTAVKMAEFVSLWTLLQDVQLTQVSDQITWRWTATGAYTSKSAYRVQFWDPSAISIARLFGKQRWRASIVSLVGY
jgi:hypothetical protein